MHFPFNFPEIVRSLFAAALLLFFAAAAFAQGASDNDDLQSWNDIDLSISVNEKFDINTSGTLRLDRNISKADSYRFTAGFTYRPIKNISFAPFHTFISARNSSGRYRYEYRSGLSATYKFPVEAFSLSHRSRIEHRSRPGRNSWRYRPSLTIEKPLPESFVKGTSVFATTEPFYDSVSGKFSRHRLSTGMKKAVTKRFAIELYYLFQGDNVSTPGAVHVLGTAWKIKL